PPELRTCSIRKTGTSTVTLRSGCRELGTRERTATSRPPSTRRSSQRAASRTLVRAPVSILALIRRTPQSGSPTYSFQPTGGGVRPAPASLTPGRPPGGRARGMGRAWGRPGEAPAGPGTGGGTSPPCHRPKTATISPAAKPTASERRSIGSELVAAGGVGDL